MSSTGRDSQFVAGRAPGWRNLSERALLDYEFTASDPESLEGISDDRPPDEEPEVEFRYDMSSRGVMVRCVYCKHPNHYHGVVLRYPSGGRRLVGRDCALSHHGIAFAEMLVEFEAAIERQSYALRRKTLMQNSESILDELEKLRSHAAVSVFDRVLREWRMELPDLAVAVANVARRYDRLAFTRTVRDVEGETARRARLGSSFEEERQRAKSDGETWQMFKHVQVDLGPLGGVAFFSDGSPVEKKIDEISHEMARVLSTMVATDLQPHQIRGGFKRLNELRERLCREFDRMDAIVDAFDSGNLERIARWANEQASEQVRLEAVRESRKASPQRDRFLASDRSITDNSGGRSKSVGLPPYQAPERRVVEILKMATSAEHEPTRENQYNY